MSPLHGFRGSHFDCVGIHLGECIVVDHSWATFSLGDTAYWRDSELGQFSNEGVGDDNEHAFGSHIPHLLSQKVGEGMSRWMVATMESSILLLLGPGLRADEDWDTFLCKLMEQGGSTMAEMTQAAGKIGSSLSRMKKF